MSGIILGFGFAIGMMLAIFFVLLIVVLALPSSREKLAANAKRYRATLATLICAPLLILGGAYWLAETELDRCEKETTSLRDNIIRHKDNALAELTQCKSTPPYVVYKADYGSFKEFARWEDSPNPKNPCNSFVIKLQQVPAPEPWPCSGVPRWWYDPVQLFRF